MEIGSNGRLRGVLAPVVTPFDADLRPDAGRLIGHCRWIVAQGAGLALFGTNSEANSMSLDERLALLDAVLEAGVDPRVMMPGTGSCALTDTVALTKRVVQAGCGGALVLPPFFFKNLSDDALFRSYSEVIQRVGDSRLRLYLYHIPQISQIPITYSLIERLLKAYPGTVAGVKDSSGVWSNTEGMLKNYQSEAFDVFCASEVYLLQTLRLGGAGSITATANVNPGMIDDLFRNWQSADAEQRQARVTTVRKTFETLPLIPGMKAAIAAHRNDPQWAEVRPPLLSTPKGKAAELQAVLARIEFQMVRG